MLLLFATTEQQKSYFKCTHKHLLNIKYSIKYIGKFILFTKYDNCNIKISFTIQNRKVIDKSKL